jgi:hypothetical protein
MAVVTRDPSNMAIQTYTITIMLIFYSYARELYLVVMRNAGPILKAENKFLQENNGVRLDCSVYLKKPFQLNALDNFESHYVYKLRQLSQGG